MKLCVLASGSTGNCVFIRSGPTSILVDAGLSARNTEGKLAEIGVGLDDIQAICLTHEHSDHICGLKAMGGRRGIAVYANRGTVEAIEAKGKIRGLPWKIFTTGSPFEVGALRIEPFSVPHDAFEPVGYLVHGQSATGEAIRMGIVTDMGMATELIRQRLRDCHALVLEANHDETLLRDAQRPWALKQRIAGRQGHLSNAQSLALLADIASPALRTVFLAHISSDCNTPDRALLCVRKGLGVLGYERIVIEPTWPERVSGVCEI